MGNILSYFFPQPAPAGIEQVVEEVREDVAARKEATEVPVVPTTEVVGMMVDAKTEDMVERDFEFVEEVAEKTNEGFEYVKEDKLENVSNVLNEGKHDLQEEFISNKVASLEATEVEIIGSVKDSDEGVQRAVTPEPIKDEASEAVDNSVNQDNENMSEVEIIGSIQERNVELVEETTTESGDLPTSDPVEPPVPGDKPINVSTPEPLIASTPEPSKAPNEPSLAPEPVKALTPETITVSTPEPAKATTPEPTVHEATTALNSDLIELSPPEPLKASTPEPQKAPTHEPLSAPEPVKALTPEVIIVSTPEPAQASNSEANIEEKNVKNAEEELSGGASGLKDLLTGSNDLNEE
eukprot:GFUD01119320.1.p1 GENE.GFUD01119320.1~~GFUD01119320.1.p1  ORF type:complete len:362 (-),score=139.65 GFUD01119320.1:125-1183(-)